jgi:hypothetical protein
MCSYPEMLPAIALPAALVWWRAWWLAGWRAGRARAIGVAIATVTALLINPATTLRAWNGFWCSVEAAHYPDRWPNIFATVTAAARPPAMATLSIPFGHDVGAVGGVVCCGVLLLALGIVLARARDRFGVVALMTAVIAMIACTLATGFGYGWQKMVQFTAVFIAAIVPVGIIAMATAPEPCARGRWLGFGWLGAAVAILFGYATFANCREAHKWSGRKFLTRDWFAARDYARRTLRNAPVLIQSDTFPRPFFYTMWATYFLTDSRVYFSGDDPRSGGYLRAEVQKDATTPVPAPRAIIVSSSWAATSNLPLGWRGDTVALLPVGWSGPRATRNVQ